MRWRGEVARVEENRSCNSESPVPFALRPHGITQSKQQIMNSRSPFPTGGKGPWTLNARGISPVHRNSENSLKTQAVDEDTLNGPPHEVLEKGYRPKDQRNADDRRKRHAGDRLQLGEIEVTGAGRRGLIDLTRHWLGHEDRLPGKVEHEIIGGGCCESMLQMATLENFWLNGLPGGTRTPYHKLRRLVLYPDELRAVVKANGRIPKERQAAAEHLPRSALHK